MRIILLNGPSSSGKTSIAKQVQQQSIEPYLLTGLDNLIYMMPEKMNDYNGTLAPHEGFGWKRRQDAQGRILHDIIPGSYGQRVYDLLFEQVRTFADARHHVIVDQVTLMRGDWDKWRQNLIHHDLFIVGVGADGEELDRREQARGDRMLGGARAQSEHVHNGFEYDLFIDTTHLPAEQAARQLLEKFEERLVHSQEKV